MGPGELLHGDALREVTGLVDIASAQDGDLARQELQGGGDGTQRIPHGRHVDDMVRDLANVLVPHRRHGDDARATCLALLEVAYGFVVRGALGGNSDDRETGVDQRDGPVLHLARRVRLRMQVADLLELEGALV